MPSGWEVYYVVFLSALLALGIPLALRIVSSLIQPRRGPGEKPASQNLEASVRSELGQRINTRFFLGTNAALILITIGLVLIPCVGAFRTGDGKESLARGLCSVLGLSGLAALALFYSARKGDLDWLRTSREGDPRGRGK